jgi:hypothetical protein
MKIDAVLMQETLQVMVALELQGDRGPKGECIFMSPAKHRKEPCLPENPQSLSQQQEVFPEWAPKMTTGHTHTSGISSPRAQNLTNPSQTEHFCLGLLTFGVGLTALWFL